MKFKTQDELFNEVNRVINKMRKDLFDSPRSRCNQILNQIGFYQGYCSAMDWEYDFDMIQKWTEFAYFN